MSILKNTMQVLLSAYLIRLLVTGASGGDSIVLFSLAGLNALQIYLEFSREPEINKDIKDRLAILESKASKAENQLGVMSLGGKLR